MLLLLLVIRAICSAPFEGDIPLTHGTLSAYSAVSNVWCSVDSHEMTFPRVTTPTSSWVERRSSPEPRHKAQRS